VVEINLDGTTFKVKPGVIDQAGDLQTSRLQSDQSSHP
jgi:hypothetical protein